jgi:ABC-type multidrug transport system fused ATPase/permease subunit
MDLRLIPKSWLPDFRRTFRFLRPHRGRLMIGMIAALGVSLSYTASISSVVPLLKVIFADHESLADWLARTAAERRLGATLPADVPNDPEGLLVEHVKAESPAADALRGGMRIVSVNGQPRDSYALTALIADHPTNVIERVVVRDYDGSRQTVRIPLNHGYSWLASIRSVAAYLPHGESPNGRMLALTMVMAGLVAITTFGGICRLLNEGCIAAAVQRAMHDVRTQLTEHVLRLPLGWHTAQPPGDTIGRFATDINRVEIGLTELFGKVVREPLKAGGVLAMTLLIDWRLLCVALAAAPIGLIAMRWLGRVIKHAQRRASQSWGALLDHLSERLAGIRVVKAFGTERAERARFERADRDLARAQTRIELVEAATHPVLEVLAMVAVAGFVLYGGSRVFSQTLEPHLFFAAVVCLGGVFDPVRKLGKVNNRIQAAEASARRLFELLDVPREADREAERGAPALPRFERTIEFRDVSFSYPRAPHKLVLDGVNLRVRRGQVVAIVGPNGSGKTTLMSLLLRFYEPTRGQILIDGNDIAAHTLASLRAQIGLVTQDAVIFSDSVFNNIAYGGQAQADDTAVREAARAAHVDDFVRSLRSDHDGAVRCGYDAHITSRSLSGGQRQRIALARAILRDPAILVLDEATSQVDSESETRIQEALEEVTVGRTTFIIAHRFSTIARADVIVVLNEGRVIASGAHAELLERSPFYMSLCETQFAVSR